MQLLNATNATIAYLEALRGQNILYRLALLIPLYIVKIAKAMVISPFVIGGSNMVTYWYPRYCREFRELLIHSLPNNLRGYHKIGLLMYFVDFYCVTACVHRLFVNRAAITYIYLALKVTLITLPFLLIAPVDRFPSWVISWTLMVFEIPIAWFVIQCVGRGIDWNAGQSFYHHWGPHYRYRRMTTNRKYTLEFSWYAYPAFKITYLNSYVCYDKFIAQYRLDYPYLPVKAGITLKTQAALDAENLERQQLGFRPALPREVSSPALPDLDYMTALTEPDTVVNMRYGILFLLALSSLSVYSIILAGWASNSKYAFIGALRSAAQMISYEVAISLILLPVVLLAGSLNLSMITYMQSITVWFLFPLLPASILFLIAMLAETNRTPFDLPEAEAELVAGYNVDYSSLPFAMFFLGEYCNMILISTLYCLLFLSGGLNSFGVNTALVLSLKAAIIWIFFVNVRATLPRYRYDQLMDIGWKVFLPIAGGFLVFIFGLLIALDALPYATELPFDTWKVSPTSTAFFDNISRHAPTFPRGPYYPGIDYIDDVLQPYNLL